MTATAERAAFSERLIQTPSSSMEPTRPPHRYTARFKAPQPPARHGKPGEKALGTQPRAGKISAVRLLAGAPGAIPLLGSAPSGHSGPASPAVDTLRSDE